MAFGYFLKTKNFFSKEFLKFGNKTVFYICLPVMLFKNIADIESLSLIRMDVIVYIVIVIAIFALIGWISTLFIKDPKQKGVIHQCIFRSNFALIGVPLSELMGGEKGVTMAAVISLFSIPIFNVMAVIVLSIYKDGKVKFDIKKIILDIVKNPLIIGVLLGFVFAFTKSLLKKNGIDLFGGVTFFNTTISFISRSATPLALLVLGGQFNIEKMSGLKKQLFIGLLGRNILAPLIGVGGACILKYLGLVDFGPEVFAALIALFGTPVAVASAIMAEAMNNDGQLAGQLVVWTTIFSLASLFVIIFIVRAMGML